MKSREFGGIHTSDQEMMKVIQIAENVAQSRATILITGESGTGKELLARHIHNKSARRNKPFVAVNCAAVPDNLLESELFGFERGAFTGADRSKMGKFEMAEGGSFLLDEISELPLALQAKLLRVIQEGEVERLGATQAKKINIRLVATTNRDLSKMVSEGLFRADLYYRLNVIPLSVPPLRHRPKDIRYLAQLFAEVSSLINNLPTRHLNQSAVQKLMQWNWPGNVRELENVMERSVLLSKSVQLSDSDILIEGFKPVRQAELTAGMTIHQAERALIFKTLEHTHNNKTQAAQLLGISIRTLRNKLNEYRSVEVAR